MNDEPTIPSSEAPQRDTDPHELKPSLAPNSVTWADVLSTHQAVLGELAGLRGDVSEMKTMLRDAFDAALNLDPRVEQLEHQAKHGFVVCKFHHSNGDEPVSPPDSEIG